MCLELIYENSESKNMVSYSYLAVEDKMIINKVFEDEDSINGINYSDFFESDSFLWIRLEDESGNPLLTSLINYFDIPEYEGSLCQELTNLYNSDLYTELIDNVIEMIIDANDSLGFTTTYIGDLIAEAFEKSDSIYIRTVDFGMYLPSHDDLHPFFYT